MRKVLTLTVVIISLTLTTKYFLENKPFGGRDKMERIELYLGAVGLETIMEYNSGDIARHGSGIDLTSLNWKPPHLGRLKVYSSKSDLEIDNIFWLQGYVFYQGFGLQKIRITSSLHLEEYATREEIYQAYVALMDQLQQKGWRQYFLPFAARLSPEDNLKNIQERSKVTAPSYILTEEEWSKQMRNPTQNLYLDLQNGDLILKINIAQKYADDEKVQYMVSYVFESKQHYNINSIGRYYEAMTLDEKKENFLEKQERNQESRKRDEERETLKGYRIDESYIEDIYDYKPY